MTKHDLKPTTRAAFRGVPRIMVVCLAAGLLAASPAPGAQDKPRVVTIADIHGAIDSFTAILQEVGLVDEDLRWSGGDSILVQTGDIFDRGPDVRTSLDLLMRLQEEATAAGGKVIVALGNHEVMNLVAYYKDTTAADTAAFADDDSEKRREEAWDRWTAMRRKLADAFDRPRPRFDRSAWEETHPLGYFERMDALGPEGEYGRWLRQLPTAVRIDNMLFMHAGLNPEFGEWETHEINERVSGELQKFDATKQTMVDAGLITRYADLVEMITTADDTLIAMIEEMEETGERPDAAGQELARALRWVVNYSDWQLLTRDGLLWFRGLAQWPEAEHADEVAELLERQGVDHIMVGHTVQADAEIRMRFGGGVFLNDTGMLTEVYHGRPSALEIHNGTFTARYVGESKVLLPGKVMNAATPRLRSRFVTIAKRQPPALPAAPAWQAQQVWMGPNGEPLPFVSDDAVLEFLRTAEITGMEEVGTGKTQPRRVGLERNGVRARAIFHTVDIYREQARVGDWFYPVFRDSWRSQIAAYGMARLLGLHNVAPTVERTIRGETGSLQLWLEGEGLRTNLARVQARDYPPDPAAWLAQEWAMQVFDALILNDDRHAQNILVDGQFKLWMIDHTRAFQLAPVLRDPGRLNRIDRRLLGELQQLSYERIAEAVDGVLAPEQINAIMERRNALLNHFSRLIDIEGEAAIVYGGTRPSERPTIGNRAA